MFKLAKNNKRPVKKAQVRGRSNSKTSKFSFLAQNRRAGLFVLFFALVGTTLLVLSRAESPFGGMPTAANQIIVQYQKGMPHPLKENGLNPSMPPVALLYGDGSLICSDNHTHHSAGSDAPATYRKRVLSEAGTRAVFNRMLDLGIKQAAEHDYNSKYIDPTGTTDTIVLNSTKGAYYAYKPQDKSNLTFDALKQYLEQECAATTEAYTPDDVTVETVPAATTSTPVADLSDQVTNLLPQGLDLGQLGTRKAAKAQRGDIAARLKERLGRGTANVYRLNGKLVKARVLTNLPQFDYPKPIQKSGKNRASAQTTRNARWIYVIPADGGANGSEQNYINDMGAQIQSYYYRHTGRWFGLSGGTVVRGRLTAGQYQQCPSGANCSVNWGNGPVHSPSLATFHNLQNEFKQAGVSVNIFYQFATHEGCIGWGGPADGSTNNINNTSYGHGFSATSVAGCNWPDGKYSVGAHETGHTFGLGHTCDSTLMGSCGQAKAEFPNVPLNATQANVLVSQSPYFNSAPKTTIQGYKVVGTGNHTRNSAIDGVEVICLDGTCVGSTNARHQRNNPYYYQNTPQGLSRIGLYNIPAGWEVIGYTLCYNATNCHANSASAMQANPLSWYTGVPSIVVDTTNRNYADLYFHFRQTGSTQPPVTPPSGSVSVRGVASGRCIDVPGQNFTSGVKVQLYDCNNTAAQLWAQQSNKALKTANNKCLDVPQQNFSDGVVVQLWECNGTAAQAWTVHSNGSIQIGNKCLDAEGGGTAGGTRIILYQCHFGNNQRWTGLSVNTGTVTPPPPTPTDPNANLVFSTQFYDYSTKVTKNRATDKTIAFNWGAGSPISGIGTEYFHGIWGANFIAPGTGTYTFYTEQDDGFALQVNNQTLIDKWNSPGPTSQGSINLTKGQTYPFAAAMYELTGNAKVYVYWKGPGIGNGNEYKLFPRI